MNVRRVVHRLTMAAAIPWAFAGCVAESDADVVANDEAEIRAARVSQNEAIAAADFARVAMFWTDDVSIRSGLGMTITGREDYAAAFGSNDAVTYVRSTTLVEVSDRWPLAWEEGTWVASRRSDGATLVRGRYSAQWRRTEDGWKIRSELFVALGCEDEGCDWLVSE